METSQLMMLGDVLFQAFWIAFALAGVILGINFAATHTWLEYEDGQHKVKGLILHKPMLWLDQLFTWLDKKKLAAWLRDLPAIVIGIGGPIAGAVLYFLVRPNPWLLSSVLLTASMLFFGKKWKDIGVFVLKCHRCMPTFWIGIPLILSGVIMFLSTWDFSYLGRIPFAVILVAMTSFWTTMIKAGYDFATAAHVAFKRIQEEEDNQAE